MTAAGCQARDETQQLPISAKDPRAKGGRSVTTSDPQVRLARRHLSSRRRSSTDDCKRFLAINNASV
eukprot:4767934-Pyramimonas_sp.AAC.1